MRWWIPLAAIGGLVVVVLVAGVILLSVQDVSKYKDVIAERVSEETGRELTIAGDFGLSISFSPAIVAEDVTLENAPWGSRPEMLKAKRLEAKVALFPMFSGRVEIKRLVLIDADVLLETNEAGAGNWELDKPEPDAPEQETASRDEPAEPSGDTEEDVEGGGLPLVDELLVKNARITYRDGQTGERHVVEIESAEGGVSDAGDFVRLEAAGQLDGTPLAANASIGTGSTDVPAKIVAEVAGASINLDGTIGDMETMKGLEAALVVEGRSLKELGTLGVGPLPDVGAYAVRGNLTEESGAYVLSDLDSRVGDSDLKGTVRFVAGDRPHMEANLTSTKLDLDAFLGEETESQPAGSSGGGTQGSSGSDGGTAPTSGGADRLFSDEPISFEGLDELDADITLEAAEALYKGITLSKLNVGVSIKNGALRVEPFSADVAGGKMTAGITLNSRSQPPELDTKLAVKGADLEALKALLDLSEVVSGPLDLDVALTGQGRSAHALASSFDGRIDLIIGEGRVHNEYIDLIAADLLRNLVPGLGDRDVARLNCFVARFAVSDGVAVSNGLLFDTDLTTTAGKGSINLGTESADLTIVPRPKDPALLSLAFPVVVHGPLNDLSYDLEREEALLGAAGAVLGTAVLGPFGVLIPLVSTGAADENPCVEALNRPAEEVVSQPKGEPSIGTSGAAGVVEEVVDELFDVFD